MVYLTIIGSQKANGVAELHSNLIKTTIFKDFLEIHGPDKFNYQCHKRYYARLHQANPRLSELIASKIGGYGFLKDPSLLEELEDFLDDKEFRKS
jgi:glycogen phosphorylase